MIIATFPTGVTDITVTGLYQWDYGQSLEIHASDLGNEVVEVHFACQKMPEAVVRSCQLSLGVGSAVIPDACLEQAKPITAWVYRVGQTSGKTVKTVTLPIIARVKPEPSATVQQSVSDRYTEAIAEMNAAVDAIEDGSVTAAEALHATNATNVRIAGTYKTLLNAIYPIGSIYMSVNSVNPSTLFGGTWTNWGSGRVPVGVNLNDSDFTPSEKTGGEKTHILTMQEMPSHSHNAAKNPEIRTGSVSQLTNDAIREGIWDSISGIATSAAGGGQAHNNLQPYITCYMWKRTA